MIMCKNYSIVKPLSQVRCMTVFQNSNHLIHQSSKTCFHWSACLPEGWFADDEPQSRNLWFMLFHPSLYSSPVISLLLLNKERNPQIIQLMKKRVIIGNCSRLCDLCTIIYCMSQAYNNMQWHCLPACHFYFSVIEFSRKPAI